MSRARADSVTATAAALNAAHVGPEDVVVLVGYSQGGLIASRLAESGTYRIGGVVTLGSPGAAVPVPDGVPVLAVEHVEDLVPALGGPAIAAASRVTVARSLYDGRPPDSTRAVPAHELAQYRSTLALADRSEEARVVAVRKEVLNRFPSGVGTAIDVRAERTGGTVSGAGGPRTGAARGR
jgi:pimeloyl-ACP methyl ester carboxylesterase